jgi:hypothetical protein
MTIPGPVQVDLNGSRSLSNGMNLPQALDGWDLCDMRDALLLETIYVNRVVPSHI